jgi:hypothetical protein
MMKLNTACPPDAGCRYCDAERDKFHVMPIDYFFSLTFIFGLMAWVWAASHGVRWLFHIWERLGVWNGWLPK